MTAYKSNILRKVKQNPTGKKISPQQFYAVKFAVSNHQEDSHGQAFTANFQSGQIQEHFQSALKQMRQGQKVELEIIPQNQTNSKQKIFLELFEVKQQPKPLSPHEEAELLKAKGNALIKQKNYGGATEVYSEGFKKIQHDCSPEAQTVKNSLMSNLSLALLHCGQYQYCVSMCDKYFFNNVLPNKKVVFRKATANKNLKKWQQANRDITLGKKICEQQKDQEGVKDFDRLSIEIRKEKQLQEKKEKQLYSRMFG